MKAFLLPAALLLLSSCGGTELTTPTSMPVRTFSAGQELQFTFVMTECSDTCSEYDVAECTTEVDGETIKVDISVPYKERVGVDSETLAGCTLVCGPQVIAHCTVPSLEPGHYMVESGTFSTEIHVE